MAAAVVCLASAFPLVPSWQVASLAAAAVALLCLQGTSSSAALPATLLAAWWLRASANKIPGSCPLELCAPSDLAPALLAALELPLAVSLVKLPALEVELCQLSSSDLPVTV